MKHINTVPAAGLVLTFLSVAFSQTLLPRPPVYAGSVSALAIPASQTRSRTFEPCKPEGSKRGCNAQGRPGQQTCDGGTWTLCVPSPPPPPPAVTGTLHPKFYVLTVVYAPPGTNGGNSASSVSYAEGSTAGSTVSVSDSFKQEYKISASAEVNLDGFFTTAEASVGTSGTTTNNQSTEITFSKTREIDTPGPAADDVDHDHDRIYLLLSPTIQMTFHPTSRGGVSAVDWKLLGGKVVFYFVGWLNHHIAMPPAELRELQNAGITPQDYPTILKADPFASLQRVRIPVNQGKAIGTSPATPDARRFQDTNNSFPYEPPLTAKDQQVTQKITITHTVSNSTGTATAQEYSVGLNLQTSATISDYVKATLKDENTWTWTDTVASSTSNGKTESVTIVVGGPAFGYQGTTDAIEVYFDTVYKTFLFWPVSSSSASLSGTVLMRSGQPAKGQEVIVYANGVRHRTFTDSRGQYHVLGRISGPLRVQAAGAVSNLPQVPATRRFDLVATR
jgi:hypothetical protein